MTPRRFLWRSLLHYRGIHGSVTLGVGVGAAVLTGALIVGTSVRGSLQELTLERLGAIDFALVGERYFRETVRDDLSAAGGAATGVLLRGSAEHAASGLRSSRVRIHGLDDSFWGFYGAEPPPLGDREIVLNRRLAAELGAAEGDAVLLRFDSDALVPAESVLGRKTDKVRLLRLTVSAVLEDRGPGRFGLSPHQQLPQNAFVSKSVLQRALEQPGRANAVFIAGGTLDSASSAWNEAFGPEDAQLAIRALPDRSGFLVESRRVVLDTVLADAVREAADEAGLASSEVLTYLANSIESGERSVPYSTVTALQEHPDSLRLISGGRPGALAGDQILLNEWTARDLQARPGGTVTLSYYVVGRGGRIETSSRDFRLAGIVRMAGAALDRDYAPTLKGMSDQARIANWDPPFPMYLRLIRPQDERYWDRYRSAPKAFVALPLAKELWTSRFGQLTSIRVRDEPGAPLAPAMAAFRQELDRLLDPAALGLSIQPVKQVGVEASAGATDFSGLFIGFSMFLIASAAILVALLFRLGVELRSREVGTRLAAGHPAGHIRRTLFGEGALVAACGCLIGLPGAVGYAAAMLYGLNTWWSGAVGGSFLQLHVRGADLAAGAAFTLVLMLASIWLSLRQLTRLSPRALLAGNVEPEARSADRDRRARRLRRIAAAAGAGAAVLLGMSLGADPAARLGAFFGAGTLCLAAALILLRSLLLAPLRTALGASTVDKLGIRNGRRNPTRSVLSATLVACATFMIVTVALNRQDASVQEPRLDSGDGGFRLHAESAAPLFLDAVEAFAAQQPEPIGVAPLRVRAGEDASCLNLYRPTQPTLASVPDSLIERGGFAFQQTLAETPEERANPWLILRRDFDGAVPVFADANSAMWILRLSLGQELVVQDGTGADRRLVLAGMISRSVFQSELLLAEEHFLDLFPDHGGYQALLAETDDPGAAASLEEAFASEGLDATRTADRVAGFLVVENTYLDTFRTLGGLGLLLGTVGLAVVMVRSVLERRRELALLESLGFGRMSIARLILAENAFLLVFGVAAGTVAAMLAVSPHLASSAADPPWAPLALTLSSIVALGLLAGCGATALSLRGPLLAGLRRD